MLLIHYITLQCQTLGYTKFFVNFYLLDYDSYQSHTEFDVHNSSSPVISIDSEVTVWTNYFTTEDTCIHLSGIACGNNTNSILKYIFVHCNKSKILKRDRHVWALKHTIHGRNINLLVPRQIYQYWWKWIHKNCHFHHVPKWILNKPISHVHVSISSKITYGCKYKLKHT